MNISKLKIILFILIYLYIFADNKQLETMTTQNTNTSEFRLVKQQDKYEVVSFNIYETEIVDGKRYDNGMIYSFDNIQQAESKLNFLKAIN